VFEDIDISGNMLTSLQWAGVLWGVQTLALDNNRLAGLGVEIGSLPNLRTLSLRSNGMLWCHKDCSIALAPRLRVADTRHVKSSCHDDMHAADIRHVEGLKALVGMRLREFRMGGNPVCAQSSNVQVVQDICPALKDVNAGV
jgi:hypothetical protein